MKLKGKILTATALVIGLVVLPSVAIHYRAKAAVEAYRKQLAARGEKMTIAEIAPHYSAEEQTSARDLFRTLGLLGSGPSNYPPSARTLVPGHALVGWAEVSLPTTESSNVWSELHPQLLAYEQSLAAARTELQNPVGGVSLDYNQGAALLLPHLATARKGALWFSVAAKLDLHDGHWSNALENLKAGVALTSVCEREPIMISQLVRSTLGQIALSDAWEALQYPGWGDRELAELQAAWKPVDILKGLEPSFQMERSTLQMESAQGRQADYNTLFGGSQPFMDVVGQMLANPKEGLEVFKNRYPRYWSWKWRGSYYDELYNMQVLQAGLEAVREIQTNGAFAPALNRLDAAIATIHIPHTNSIFGSPWGWEVDSGQSYLRKIGYIEMERRLLLTAIALKRFQLAQGQYPAELKELVPTYLAAVPLDAMDGKPLRYHPKPDGAFLLYSVGADGVDNGGDPTPTDSPDSTNKRWWTARDAVWPMPATPEETKAYKEKTLAEWTARHPAKTASKPKR